MAKSQYDWETMLEVLNLLGQEPTPEFLEIMKKEKEGTITKDMINEAIEKANNKRKTE